MRQVVHDVLSTLPAPTPRQGRVWSHANLRHAFEAAVDRAEIDDFRLHDCRHHVVSWFVMRGGESGRAQGAPGA
jgi:hypothetical protein